MSTLPPGWVASTVGQCFLDVRNGTTATQNANGIGLPVSRIETVQNSRFDLRRIRHVEDVQSLAVENFRYRPGDIAFSHINSYEHVGKTALYDGTPELFIHGMNLLRLRLGHNQIVPRFAHLFMQTSYFREEVRRRVGHAVNQVSINQKNLADVPFLFAPIAEQRRIVAKVEKLLEKVDGCEQRLAKIPVILKHFRQSVLAAACSGRLTADWREAVDEGDMKSATPIAEVLVEEIFETPAHWRWLPLNMLCDPTRAICYGVIKLGSKHSGGIPCLRTSDVKPLRIDTVGVKQIAPEISDQYTRTILRGGEVLVNVRGTLGGVAVVPSDLRDWNISREIALVPVTKVLPKFVAFWIATLPCQNWLTGVAKGVAYTGINIEDLRRLPIALPSLAEQQEIVRRVTAFLTLADHIEARYQDGKKRVDGLAQSILAKAFRGELVPTEAELAKAEGRSFQSGEELLKGIQLSGLAAPEKTTASNRRRSRSRKAAVGT